MAIVFSFMYVNIIVEKCLIIKELVLIFFNRTSETHMIIKEFLCEEIFIQNISNS